MSRRKPKWYSSALRMWQNCAHHHRNTSIPGTYCLEATWEHSPVPIAQLWYCWHGKTTLAILGCYTMTFFRRHRIMTRLLNELVRDFPKALRVTTEAATPDSKPFLLKCGFVETPADGWTLEIPNRGPNAPKLKPKNARRPKSRLRG